MLKMSKYTLFQKNRDEYLLFNTFSKAFLGISFKDDKLKNKIDRLINGEILLENEQSADFNILVEQGILTNLYPEDEDKLLENNFYSNYFLGDVAAITLAPSLSCNLNCNYCYQAGYRQDKKNLLPGISWDENAFEFVKNFIKSKGLKKITFIWFGGEPLIYYQLLKKFSDNIKKYYADKPIKIKFDIITNGTLLSKDILLIFIDLPIDSAQITIDGPERIHNSMRPYINGGKTYQDIISNITQLLNITKVNISLRFNLSLENSDLKYYAEFISTMAKNFGHFIKNRRLRLEYPVLANNAFLYKNQISLNEYSKNFITYLKILSDAGIAKNKTFKYMPPFCTARSNNSLLIGPGSDIYKCWEHIGNPDYVIGNAISGLNKIKENEWKIIGSHYYHKKCLGCKLLPICMGGCPLKYGKYKAEPECPFFSDLKIFWEILKFTNGIIR